MPQALHRTRGLQPPTTSNPPLTAPRSINPARWRSHSSGCERAGDVDDALSLRRASTRRPCLVVTHVDGEFSDDEMERLYVDALAKWISIEPPSGSFD